MKKSLFIVFFCLCFFAESASASLILLRLEGPIVQSGVALQGTFPVGQNTVVAMTIETSTPIQLINNRQAFRIDAITNFSVTSGSYSANVAGPFGQINVYDNLSGTDGIQFQVASNSSTYQFTDPKPLTISLPNGPGDGVFDNFFGNLASSGSTLYNSYDIPTTYNLADYNSTRNLNFAFSNGVFSTGINNITVTAVPEASTTGLLLVGSGGLVWAVRRRAAKS